MEVKFGIVHVIKNKKLNSSTRYPENTCQILTFFIIYNYFIKIF